MMRRMTTRMMMNIHYLTDIYTPETFSSNNSEFHTHKYWRALESEKRETARLKNIV